MQSSISRTPLVPEGGVPLEKGVRGVGGGDSFFFFFSTLSTLVDGGDYRLVCWGCLVTVIAG